MQNLESNNWLICKNEMLSFVNTTERTAMSINFADDTVIANLIKRVIDCFRVPMPLSNLTNAQRSSIFINKPAQVY